MITFWNIFVKITGWLPQFLCFRTKIYYENRKVQGRHIRGPAIIISNHTSVFDYAVYIFVFFTRTLRFQMAEVLFEKKALARLLKMLGGIFVNRNDFDFGFMAKSRDILDSGGVVGVFPEGRLPRPGEPRPLEFKTSAAYLALSSGVPVIPVVTNGSYFRPGRARVLIGEPIDVSALSDRTLPEKEDLLQVSEKLRRHITELESILHGYGEKTKG